MARKIRTSSQFGTARTSCSRRAPSPIRLRGLMPCIYAWRVVAPRCSTASATAPSFVRLGSARFRDRGDSDRPRRVQGLSPLLGFARLLQPAAAALVLGSFCAPKGVAAGFLTAPWLVMALVAAIGGVTDAWRRRGVRPFDVSLVAAQVFLPIGAVWLVLWRLGVGPRQFSPLTVSLAALHFHFNGFTAQVLIGATGRRLRGASSRLLALHRFVAVAAIAGLPLLAAGKFIPAPALRITGVGAITLGFVGLCVTSTAVAVAAQSALTRDLLLASAASAAAAVGLACAYGVGELAGRDWIGLGRMVATHGLLMSLGFTLCGLVGHLRLRRA